MRTRRFRLQSRPSSGSARSRAWAQPARSRASRSFSPPTRRTTSPVRSSSSMAAGASHERRWRQVHGMKADSESMTSPGDPRPWLRHYDYWVPHHMTYPRRPLHEILDAAAIDVPDRPATAFFGATLTFQAIKDRSDRLAAALAGFGLMKGDRVGIMLPNCPQYIISAFAVLRHGAILVNINPTYTAREVLAVATDSGICALVTLDVLTPLVTAVRAQTRIRHVVITSLAEYSAAKA